MSYPVAALDGDVIYYQTAKGVDGYWYWWNDTRSCLLILFIRWIKAFVFIWIRNDSFKTNPRDTINDNSCNYISIQLHQDCFNIFRQQMCTHFFTGRVSKIIVLYQSSLNIVPIRIKHFHPCHVFENCTRDDIYKNPPKWSCFLFPW